MISKKHLSSSKDLMQEQETQDFICNHCRDTHRVQIDSIEALCTWCPVPCVDCRSSGIGAYCTNTPCMCGCHVEKFPHLDWYKEPLSKEHIADLRFKLAVCRGIIGEILDGMKGHCTLSPEDLERVLKETADP